MLEYCWIYQISSWIYVAGQYHEQGFWSDRPVFMIDFVNTGNCFLTLFSKPVSVLKLKMASSIRQLRNNTAAKHVTWVTCQTWHQARENTWVRFWLVWKTACLLWLIRARWTNVFFFCFQDVTDFEWEFWLSAIKSLMPAMLLHTIGGIIFSRFLSQVRNLFFSLLENLWFFFLTSVWLPHWLLLQGQGVKSYLQ